MNKSGEFTDHWTGTLGISKLSMAYVGVVGPTRRSTSMAHRILIEDGRAKRVSLVPQGRLCAPLPNGGLAAIVYLDPRRFALADAQALAARWRTFSPEHNGVGDLLDDLDSWGARPLDGSLACALELLREGIRPADAARQAGMSESKMVRLFNAQLGAPPKSWLMWMRLRRSLDHLLEGGTVTQAAHEAEFADSSHFSRACSKAFGIAPSLLGAMRGKVVQSGSACIL